MPYIPHSVAVLQEEGEREDKREGREMGALDVRENKVIRFSCLGRGKECRNERMVSSWLRE